MRFVETECDQFLVGFCDMLKLQGCDQFWSYDQCLCRKEAMDEGQRFDGVWKVSLMGGLNL